MPEQTFTQRVIALVKKIPRGKVATYGQVAALAGNPRGARQVVRALYTAGDEATLPWHRLINAQGAISLTGEDAKEQRRRLAKEGVKFDAEGKIDLERYRWRTAAT